MQFKNSMLLLTALSAGSAVARLNGHQRRHAHPKHEVEVDPDVLTPALPMITHLPDTEAEIEPRAVGDVVSCTIDGVLQTWINNWSGEVSSAESSAAAAVPTTTSTTTPTVVPTTTAEASPTEVESSVSAVPTGGGGDWYTYPKDGSFCTEGFGKRNYQSGQPLGILWSGNTGIPWGSNIIEVKENEASKYRNIIKFEGANKEDWTVIFFNKKGPDGEMTGWYNHRALTFTISPGQNKYVAIDSFSTGGWTAFPGTDCPLDQNGGYAATWGEFTVMDAPGTSSWDVSCIQAQNAKKTIQGMKICDHHHGQCSSISNGLSKMINAYTSAEAHLDGIGGNIKSEAVRLLVNLDYAD
ncbi:hypothetical protein N7492_008922 [Penicillium capsulatum]|uniref:Allergen Asp f 4 n=1 Tax=Penicillium capsulatum TaxID=69766 RepID=A0A9W9LH90_9EURO|nr:hypothetical protein N7492_008922 [Penicillium capsulatum]KAJ6106322.1 hypothetical protein N7512_009839 [Penicillium capsulatum]